MCEMLTRLGLQGVLISLRWWWILLKGTTRWWTRLSSVGYVPRRCRSRWCSFLPLIHPFPALIRLWVMNLGLPLKTWQTLPLALLYDPYVVMYPLTLSALIGALSSTLTKVAEVSALTLIPKLREMDVLPHPRRLTL